MQTSGFQGFTDKFAAFKNSHARIVVERLNAFPQRCNTLVTGVNCVDIDRTSSRLRKLTAKNPPNTVIRCLYLYFTVRRESSSKIAIHSKGCPKLAWMSSLKSLDWEGRYGRTNGTLRHSYKSEKEQIIEGLEREFEKRTEIPTFKVHDRFETESVWPPKI